MPVRKGAAFLWGLEIGSALNAYQFGIKKKVLDMAINDRGIRDTARVLGINKKTVISTLKKRR